MLRFRPSCLSCIKSFPQRQVELLMQIWQRAVCQSKRSSDSREGDKVLTAASAPLRIEQISAAVHRSEQGLRERDATFAGNNAEVQRLNAEIERISNAFSRVENELKEREKTIGRLVETRGAA